MAMQGFMRMKKELESAIDAIREKNPALAEHLTESIEMDEAKGTFGYRPDTPIKWRVDKEE